jgi:putative tricarboxylic transport membrane protein
VPSRTADLIGAGLLVALGITMAITSVGYDLVAEGGGIGPGLMPFTAAILLIAFGAAVGAESLRSSHERHSGTAKRDDREPERQSDAAAQPDGDDGHEAREISGKTVALVFALTLAAIAFVPLLGFLAPFAVLIFVLVTLVERQGWVRGAVLGVTASAITWLIFVRLLQIPLPTGILEATPGI